MDFNEALKIVNTVISGLENEEYDGIIVKRLEASNTLDGGRTTNQTHIALTGEQMNIFPYIMSDGYFGCNYDEKDEALKKYFVTQIPMNLYKENIEYLCNEGEAYGIIFNDNGIKNVKTTVVRSRRKEQADQVQMSLLNMDSPDFVEFRKLIHVGDYLVILKHKEKLEYDCIAIRGKDEQVEECSLSMLHNKFYKLNTNTKVEVNNNIFSNERKNDDKANNGTNILLYGVPGCGKSHEIQTMCKNEDLLERVVFHPDYTYSDFVGQILPQIKKEEGSNSTIEYKFIPGPFTRILKACNDDKDTMRYLIIEEINRGNAPAIFGEIFQLLDRCDDAAKGIVCASEYGISNSDIAEAVYGNENSKVRIPNNLTILATMNTADQNVFTLDTAFKRRWKMKAIRNKFIDDNHCNHTLCDTTLKWKDFAKKINQKIIEFGENNLGSEDNRLGVYFLKDNEMDDIEIFSEKILMYLWNDAFKYNHEDIFDNSYKTLEDLVDGFSENKFKVFNADLGFQSLINVSMQEIEQEADETIEDEENGR